MAFNVSLSPAKFAAMVHLCCSVLVAVLLSLFVFLIWHPAPLHKAVGVSDIFILLLIVDVILGPLLTLVVYKPAKKTLKFDMFCIITLQLIALIYGCYKVAEGRPAWLVFNVDRFDLVQAYQLDPRYDEKVLAKYQHPPWFGPSFVGARAPKNSKAKESLMFESVFAGLDLPQRPLYYVPLINMADDIKAKKHSLDELMEFNDRLVVKNILDKWPSADSWLPLMAAVVPMVVLIDSTSAKVVAVVDLRPWN